MREKAYRDLPYKERGLLTFKAKLHLKSLPEFKCNKSEIDSISNAFALHISEKILSAENRELADIVLTEHDLLGTCVKTGAEFSVSIKHLTDSGLLEAYNKIFPARSIKGRYAHMLPSGDAEIVDAEWNVVFKFRQLT